MAEDTFQEGSLLPSGPTLPALPHDPSWDAISFEADAFSTATPGMFGLTDQALDEMAAAVNGASPSAADPTALPTIADWGFGNVDPMDLVRFGEPSGNVADASQEMTLQPTPAVNFSTGLDAPPGDVAGVARGLSNNGFEPIEQIAAALDQNPEKYAMGLNQSMQRDTQILATMDAQNVSTTDPHNAMKDQSEAHNKMKGKEVETEVQDEMAGMGSRGRAQGEMESLVAATTTGQGAAKDTETKKSPTHATKDAQTTDTDLMSKKGGGTPGGCTGAAKAGSQATPHTGAGREKPRTVAVPQDTPLGPGLPQNKDDSTGRQSNKVNGTSNQSKANGTGRQGDKVDGTCNQSKDGSTASITNTNGNRKNGASMSLFINESDSESDSDGDLSSKLRRARETKKALAAGPQPAKVGHLSPCAPEGNKAMAPAAASTSGCQPRLSTGVALARGSQISSAVVIPAKANQPSSVVSGSAKAYQPLSAVIAPALTYKAPSTIAASGSAYQSSSGIVGPARACQPPTAVIDLTADDDDDPVLRRRAEAANTTAKQPGPFASSFAQKRRRDRYPSEDISESSLLRRASNGGLPEPSFARQTKARKIDHPTNHAAAGSGTSSLRPSPSPGSSGEDNGLNWRLSGRDTAPGLATTHKPQKAAAARGAGLASASKNSALITARAGPGSHPKSTGNTGTSSEPSYSPTMAPPRSANMQKSSLPRSTLANLTEGFLEEPFRQPSHSTVLDEAARQFKEFESRQPKQRETILSGSVPADSGTIWKATAEARTRTEAREAEKQLRRRRDVDRKKKAAIYATLKNDHKDKSEAELETMANAHLASWRRLQESKRGKDKAVRAPRPPEDPIYSLAGLDLPVGANQPVTVYTAIVSPRHHEDEEGWEEQAIRSPPQLRKSAANMLARAEMAKIQQEETEEGQPAVVGMDLDFGQHRDGMLWATIRFEDGSRIFVFVSRTQQLFGKVNPAQIKGTKLRRGFLEMYAPRWDIHVMKFKRPPGAPLEQQPDIVLDDDDDDDDTTIDNDGNGNNSNCGSNKNDDDADVEIRNQDGFDIDITHCGFFTRSYDANMRAIELFEQALAPPSADQAVKSFFRDQVEEKVRFLREESDCVHDGEGVEFSFSVPKWCGYDFERIVVKVFRGQLHGPIDIGDGLIDDNNNESV